MAYTKEERAAYDRARYLANKEKRAEQMKDYRLANPKKMAAHKKVYFLKLNLMNKKISKRTLKAWAAQVKQKDCYTCRDCGATDNLHAHHIFSKTKHPHRALELDNGTTLCELCHIYEHQLNGEK
jgi:5-methylcytosine-specific restriction endonuclease McrA